MQIKHPNFREHEFYDFYEFELLKPRTSMRGIFFLKRRSRENDKYLLSSDLSSSSQSYFLLWQPPIVNGSDRESGCQIYRS